MNILNRYFEQNQSNPTQQFERNENAIVITDEKGQIVTCNAAAEDLTGYDENELIGKNCSIFSNRHTPREVYQQLWRTISSGREWRGNLLNRKKSGEPYIADLTITPIKEGDIIGYYSKINDISQTISSHKNEENNQFIFERILNITSLAIVVIDTDFNIVFSNKGFTCKVGNAYFDDFILPTIKQNVSISELCCEKLQIDVNHDQRSFDCVIDPVQLANTSTNHYFVDTKFAHAVINITERTNERRLLENQRLNHLKLNINDSKHVHSIQEVLMGTIHKFQAPVNMLDSAVKILSSRNHNCSGLEMMKGAIEEAYTALKFIQTHIPERHAEPLQNTNINEIIKDACSISSQALIEHYIHIDLDLHPNLTSCNAHPSRLTLALIQLIDNAIEEINRVKAQHRQIIIRSYTIEGSICISIEDSGNGIASSDYNRVFQPFYTNNPLNTDRCRGMGLSIVQQVINDHEGMLVIEPSMALSGAKFVISLPSNCKEAK
ncbi:nitrogen fixation negative regulator NifL [Vibrio agarivorans]|uniref:nitrogen fixation negative regulator NifL n=1 Tax=Vibrio agarivorans TaxID=153622 RepID=UPI00222FAEB2|nr:nitrogen fixation negative regulator NifL [Vibrio agarivorans]